MCVLIFATFCRVNGRICLTNQSCTRMKKNNCFVYQCTHFSSAVPLKYLRHSLQHLADLHRCMSSSVRRKSLQSAFPVVDGAFQLIHRHVFEANLQNSQACQQRYEVIYTKQPIYLPFIYFSTTLFQLHSHASAFSLSVCSSHKTMNVRVDEEMC